MEHYSTIIIIVIALALDRLLGEPRLHPLILFGNIAGKIEKRLNKNNSFSLGVISTIAITVPPVAFVGWIQWIYQDSFWVSTIIASGILYFAIGWQSMKDHAYAVESPLLSNNITQAREQLSQIVSRDTSTMHEQQIVGSTLESILENSNDCLFASLFWSIVLGPFAVLLHRLINTLDAMWGYKNQRFAKFGTFSARLDDVLGYIPARLTAISFALIGNTRNSIRCWRSQAPVHKSPNGGVVMSSGAGALKLKFGGPTFYNGVVEDKPFLGNGSTAKTSDIRRSVSLVEKASLLWVSICMLGVLLTLIF